MITLVRPVQCQNATSPMLVTQEGIVTLVRPEQPKNAPLPMLVTVLGIIVVLQPVTNVFVAVSMIALQFLLESYFVLLVETTMLVRFLQRENTS